MLREKIREYFKKMKNAPELDQLGISPGSLESLESLESLTNTEAETFPNVPEEYMPHERVIDNSGKK